MLDIDETDIENVKEIETKLMEFLKQFDRKVKLICLYYTFIDFGIRLARMESRNLEFIVDLVEFIFNDKNKYTDIK